jgi:hypothetical protein
MNLSLGALMRIFAVTRMAETDVDRARKLAESHPELAPCPKCDFIKKHCKCEENEN